MDTRSKTGGNVLMPLLMVYFFWGTTYLAMRIAIETIPPWIMVAARLLAAGTLLYVWCRLTGAPRPTLQHWRGAGVTGVLLLVTGNAVVAWAEQTVPSGVASLLVATVPLWVLVLGWLGKGGARPRGGSIIGVLMGLAGLAVLVLPSLRATDAGAIDRVGLLAMLFAALSWAAGSLYSRTAKLPPEPLLGTAMEMLVGGGLILVVSLVSGDWGRFALAAVSTRSLLALAYLVAFGSIVGFSAYTWLLKHAEPMLVSTYAFVNPIVAVALGWVVLGERLTANSLIAAVIIVAAVVLITLSQGRPAAGSGRSRHRARPTSS